MKIYVVFEVIDDYPESGGGEYADAIFFNLENAKKYAERKQQEWDAHKDCEEDNYFSWEVRPWETSDEIT